MGAPLELYHTQVEPDWVDYNGHMTESAYLTRLRLGPPTPCSVSWGSMKGYRAGGHSFYTVETHIHYRREATVHQELFFTTQVLGVDERRLHIFHAMHDKDGRRLSSTEQMLLHVDTDAGAAVPILPGPARALAAVGEAHRKLGVPPEVGSRMSLDRRG